MTDDRTTVSLSQEADLALGSLVEEGWFATEITAYQAAVALALARGLSHERPRGGGSRTTKFNVGSLDSRIRDLVSRFGPTGVPPIEASMGLAEAGLRAIRRTLDEEGSLTSAFGLADPGRDGAAMGPLPPYHSDEEGEATIS